MVIERGYAVIESADLSSVLAKGYADPTQPSPDEALRFQGYIELLFAVWERAYMTREAGIFSDDLFGEWNS